MINNNSQGDFSFKTFVLLNHFLDLSNKLTCRHLLLQLHPFQSTFKQPINVSLVYAIYDQNIWLIPPEYELILHDRQGEGYPCQRMDQDLRIMI